MGASAVFYAALSGVFWGFGPLGKRFGVETGTRSHRVALSISTFLVYSIGTMAIPVAGFLTTKEEHRREVFASEEWRSRLPFVVLCGVLSGCGGLMATYALAVAGSATACLISMVENGIYSTGSVALIMIAFGEQPTVLEWLSGAMLLAGILLAEVARWPAAGPGGPGPEAADQRLAGDQGAPGAEAYGCHAEALEKDAGARRCEGFLTSDAAALPCAVLAGVLWSFGPLGKRYGAGGAEEGLRASQASCTFFLYMTGAMGPVVVAALYSLLTGRMQAAVDGAWFLRRAPAVLACGTASGFGGVLGTYAFAIAGRNESGLIAMVENGVYTVVAAMLIAIIYQEQPNSWQWGSAALILGAVLLVDAS